MALGANYGLAMALVAGSVAIIIVILMSFSRETRDKQFITAQTGARAQRVPAPAGVS
jgi:hypothetical protein